LRKSPVPGGAGLWFVRAAAAVPPWVTRARRLPGLRVLATGVTHVAPPLRGTRTVFVHAQVCSGTRTPRYVGAASLMARYLPKVPVPIAV
jgi:hypothetical protein